MAAIKSFTDLDQSKKLAEILPLESADMCCFQNPNGSINYYGFPFLQGNKDSNPIPCWSLSALLELMPQRIVGPFGELWHLGLEKDWDKVSYIVYYENKNSFVQRKAKDPIDACIEMIDWLISNGQKLLSK